MHEDFTHGTKRYFFGLKKSFGTRILGKFFKLSKLKIPFLAKGQTYHFFDDYFQGRHFSKIFILNKKISSYQDARWVLPNQSASNV